MRMVSEIKNEQTTKKAGMGSSVDSLYRKR